MLPSVIELTVIEFNFSITPSLNTSADSQNEERQISDIPFITLSVECVWSKMAATRRIKEIKKRRVRSIPLERDSFMPLFVCPDALGCLPLKATSTSSVQAFLFFISVISGVMRSCYYFSIPHHYTSIVF
jgi:hypothetical protein